MVGCILKLKKDFKSRSEEKWRTNKWERNSPGQVEKKKKKNAKETWKTSQKPEKERLDAQKNNNNKESLMSDAFSASTTTNDV